LAPAWDIRCCGRGLEWGRHATIDGQDVRPAGKALNVSRALAWLGIESVAAGLWGREDYAAMQQAVQRLGGLIQVAMTPANGHTRRNVTVVDSLHEREMHLRLSSALATPGSLRALGADLGGLVGLGDCCVFAGAMPTGALLDDFIALVRECHARGARIVADTHGPALERLVQAGLPWLIKPNVEELSGLLGREIEDTPASLATAGRTLLEKVDAVLISRGENGAVLVTKEGAWAGRCDGPGRVVSTVGCGDYLLAGFLAASGESTAPRETLATALKVATACAYAWSETRSWPEVEGELSARVAPAE
jgi:1-phosphofructokinase family hexose kinase